MRCLGQLCAVAVLGSVVSVGIPAQQAAAQLTGAHVHNSLVRGIGYLQRLQNPDGSWPQEFGHPGGLTALCGLALHESGVPADHAMLRKTTSYLRQRTYDKTYSVALQTMFLCAVGDTDDLPLLQRNVTWLAQAQQADGSWSYTEGQSQTGDGSNSQYALLALYEAERFHSEILISDEVWAKAHDFWKSLQNRDGSWGYRLNDRQGTGSMTAAGLASVLIAHAKEREDVLTGNGRLQCCSEPAEPNEIFSGRNWMIQNFSVREVPGLRGHSSRLWLWYYYYMYGLERAARLDGKRLIGQHDWYREGAAWLVQQQQADGSWYVGATEDEVAGIRLSGTALALLFLAKGRRPVLWARLEHEPRYDANQHPQALPELTARIQRRWKQNLSWQSVDPRLATVEELLQVPVLFLSGRVAPVFSDAEIAKLRTYVERGGFLFAEQCCRGTEFDAGFRALVAKMFPEPECQLTQLPPEHPVWRLEEVVPPEEVGCLWGVNVGCRTSIIFCDRDLSCRWQYLHPRVLRPMPFLTRGDVLSAGDLGQNVLAYATNREVKYRSDFFDSPTQAPKVDAAPRGEFRIAQVLHNGDQRTAPLAVPNLLRALWQAKQLRVDLHSRELSLAQPDIYDFPLLYLHGREEFQFSPEERRELRSYLDRGGVLLADSVCSRSAFVAAFRKEMAATFPDRPLERVPADHEMFSSKLGGYDLARVRYRIVRASGLKGTWKMEEEEGPPELEGIKIGERYVVLFSARDISCTLQNPDRADCPGYVAEDALRLGINAILYAIHQPGP